MFSFKASVEFPFFYLQIWKNVINLVICWSQNMSIFIQFLEEFFG